MLDLTTHPIALAEVGLSASAPHLMSDRAYLDVNLARDVLLTLLQSQAHIGVLVSSHLRLVKVGQFIFTSLPDCMARDSKSRVISTKASFTLIKLVNAAGLPGCLSGWLLYDFFLKATLTSL